jgi:hypothetical protein
MIKKVDDIFKEKEQEEKEKLKETFKKDVDEMIRSGVKTVNAFIDEEKRKKIAMEEAMKKKSKGKWIFRVFLKILALLVVLLFIVNFVLFNIWIFKYFITNIF